MTFPLFNYRLESFSLKCRRRISQTVQNVGLRAEWHKVLLNLNVTDHNIDIDTEEKMLLNRVLQQYVKRISVRAAVS